MTATLAPANALAELTAVAGEAHVSADVEALRAYAIDGVLPAVRVNAQDPQQIASVLEACSRHQLAVVAKGAFQHLHIGGVPERVNVLLDVAGMSGIEHYDPGDLTIGVHAGTTIEELDRALAQHHQFLPLEGAASPKATIGGVLATSSNGPLRQGFGGLRDYCIGVTFVTGDGKLAKGGGRVVKNVAGYDLMKLMIGSYGSLGVIVGANFKVFPRPRQTKTFVLEFVSAEDLLSYRDGLVRSVLSPIALEMISPRAAEYAAGGATEFPEVDDVDFAPAPDRGQAVPQTQPWRLLVRASGSDAVLARYARELGASVVQSFSGEDEHELWRGYNSFEHTAVARHHNVMMLRASVPPAQLARLVQSAEAAAVENNFLAAFTGRVGIGSLNLAFVPLLVDPPSAMQYARAASALRASLPSDCSVMVTRCPREGKPHFDVWGTPSGDRELMRRVKHALDPAGILNRGRFVV